VSKIFILSQQNVYPTLSQYIDPENIPKKYGGQLDFEWGDMPHLEPEIDAAIKWENPATQKGKNTFPIGPIKWEHGEDGSMTAVAVGTENGKPRRKTIFTIQNPVSNNIAEKGQAVINTPVDESELRLTTVGTATQPPDPDPATVDIEPPSSDSPTPAATPKLQPEETASARAPSQDLALREGTSESRYEQQHQTHAKGKLAEGTPHAAVNDHGHGDKTVTMEPGTVGQAPKDVTIEKEEPPAPGYLEQAKNVAAQATAAVTSTVGAATSTVANLTIGSKAEEKVEESKPEKSPAEKELEEKIDGKDDPTIEGFLRSKTASGAAPV
jgi:hypothetical protein